ncbi:hypothetical protein ACFWBV_24595 [Streptomyces sp. NPDC060030]|uniref:hypothetical protein n=1 Tax=Streptomyces sp. NPDC060030 TaxID=3347042 RepID=UPI0036A3BFA5
MSSDDAALEVSFRRLSGRSGPGAGRPAKMYRRAEGEQAVSVPPRSARGLHLPGPAPAAGRRAHALRPLPTPPPRGRSHADGPETPGALA